MISLRMYAGKWQIIIGEEVWEFPSLYLMEQALATMIKLKDDYGKLGGRK